MSINIKDPEVHRLARELARMSGKSMTRVVRESLEARYEALAREQQRAGVDELMNIARRVSKQSEGGAPDHGELLYDEHGLPR
ncbi:MAG: type II toxin-antitoxin system VapB family antitoxin [Wenzhouxiangellaceae bacterium]